MYERDYLREVIRHHGWATLTLLAHLRTLPADDMKLRAAGTFGRLEVTMTHVVKADEDYLEWLTGKRMFPTLPPLNEIGDVDLGDLTVRATSNAQRFLSLVDALPDPLSSVEDEGEVVRRGAIFVQAVSHANEHRAQVGTILGTNGRPTVDVDGWAYARQGGTQSTPAR